MLNKIVPMVFAIILSFSSTARAINGYDLGYTKGKDSGAFIWKTIYTKDCFRLQEFKADLSRFKRPPTSEYNRGYNAGVNGALSEIKRQCKDDCKGIGKTEGRLYGDLFCNATFATFLKSVTTCGAQAYAACLEAFENYVDASCYQKQLDEPDAYDQFKEAACNGFLQ